MIYLFLSSGLFFAAYRKLKRDERRINFSKLVWFLIILILVFLIWLGYFLHHILFVIAITSAPLMFSLSLFVLFYLVITHPDFSLSSDLFRFKKSKLLPAEARFIYQKIVDQYHRNKTYMDPDLTLRSLSKIMNIQSYKISRAINLEVGQSFTRFTNQFRIEAAIESLKNKKKPKRNILEIALDCGFNSLSAFNSAFKKITGLTPSSFK
jgi:AraC-like DNA-binding protein